VLVLALPASAQAPEPEPEPGAGAEAEEPGGEEPLPGEEGLPPEPGEPAPSDADLKTSKEDVAPTTPVLTTGPKRGERQKTWKDIVVIPRKPFLKRRRVEITPYFATTLNDTLIQHSALGVEFNYFLTDILSIGIQGMYFFKNVLDQEFFTRYHFSRVPSLNKYIYTVTGNFSYVPVYGKFSLFNKMIFHYEAYATAGVGISGTEIIPRDYRFEIFTNHGKLTFPIGLGARFFVTKWLAVQAAYRCYILLDSFEPSQRGVEAPGKTEVETAKDAAKTDIVFNMMFNLGVSIFLPMDFKYTTFR
jgi:outer membrane beta-barrel protein